MDNTPITYTKLCPKCNELLFFLNKKYLDRSIKNNKVCVRCCQKGKKHSEETKLKMRMNNKQHFLGKHLTEEHRRKLSLSHKDQISHNKGIPMSEEQKKKLSIAHKGKILSEEHKNNISKNSAKTFLGKHLTEETKRKLRISKLQRFEKLGIGNREDVGAREWFDKYNIETNSNFQPKTFMDIGYIADGYDEDKHIWIEYDTERLNAFKRFDVNNNTLNVVYGDK